MRVKSLSNIAHHLAIGDCSAFKDFDFEMLPQNLSDKGFQTIPNIFIVCSSSRNMKFLSPPCTQVGQSE